MTIVDLAAILRGDRMMTTDTGGRERPSRDEIGRLATTTTKGADGATARMSRAGCPPNGN
jgi:hypothetical protein